jgi:hypothetical protein
MITHLSCATWWRIWVRCVLFWRHRSRRRIRLNHRKSKGGIEMGEPGENVEVSHEPGFTIPSIKENYFSKKSYRNPSFKFSIHPNSVLLSSHLDESGTTITNLDPAAIIYYNLTELINKYCKKNELTLTHWEKSNIKEDVCQLYNLIMTAGKNNTKGLHITICISNNNLIIKKIGPGDDNRYKHFLEAIYTIVNPNGDTTFLEFNSEGGGRHKRHKSRTHRKRCTHCKRRTHRKTKSRRSRK